MRHTVFTSLVISGLILILLSGCQKESSEATSANESLTQDRPTQDTPSLTVYKTPSCGCCNKWLDHLAQSGVTFESKNLSSLAQLKTDHNIAPKYRSCHTGISSDGYVVEGHVPAKTIRRFLNNPPENALGLSVPSMPIGSPGMEVDDGNGGTKFMPYTVLLLRKNGSSEVYESMPTYSSQF